MNVTELATIEDLEQLRTQPQGSFCLTADIDLKGGAWEPVDFFGCLDGRGHRISNLKITTATEKGHQGFFGCVAEEARIKNLQLTGLQIIICDRASAIGGIAGCNLGTVEGCTLGADAPYKPTKSGKRNILQGDCDKSYILSQRSACIGAAAGENHGTVTGIRSYLELLVPADAPVGLCGKGEAQGLWRDVTNRTSMQGSRAVAMRQSIVDYMFAMGDVCWVPSKDLAFTTAYSDGINVVYAKGVPHYGLPYTQKYGTLERMVSCLGKDDYVTDELPGYSDAGDKDPGNTLPGWDIYLGNDCSGAVFWSWARCCPSVSFAFTGHMIPTAENQKKFGVLPVGDYTAGCENTLTVMEENDPNVILESYAKLRMADAIVMRSPAHGHTRLVFRDPVVMRNEQGVIDPDESYLPTHEQGVGKGSSGRDSTWQLNCRYTFRELSKDYLPITNIELLQGSAAPVQVWLENGKVHSNYRVISTTVTLRQGEEEKISTVFSGVVNRHEEDPGRGDSHARDTVTFGDLAAHKKNLSGLTGQWDYNVSVLLACGTSFEVCDGQCTL